LIYLSLFSNSTPRTSCCSEFAPPLSFTHSLTHSIKQSSPFMPPPSCWLLTE
jgi:hypothetical protein